MSEGATGLEPWAVAAPGMMVREVHRASGVVMRLPAVTEPFAVLQPKEAHRVRVPLEGDRVLELEAGLFTIIDVRHGTVARLLATPQLSHASIVQAIDRCQYLTGRLQDLGFVLREQLDANEIHNITSEHERARVAAFTAPFGSGCWRADIWIAVAARAHSKLADMLRLSGHGCLVSVDIWDEALTVEDVT